MENNKQELTGEMREGAQIVLAMIRRRLEQLRGDESVLFEFNRLVENIEETFDE